MRGRTGRRCDGSTHRESRNLNPKKSLSLTMNISHVSPMQKSPEQIYDEVEARWERSRKEQRQRLWRRGGEILLLGMVGFGVMVWAIPHQPWFAGATPPLIVFAWMQLRRIERLEDRVRTLERRGSAED